MMTKNKLKCVLTAFALTLTQIIVGCDVFTAMAIIESGNDPKAVNAKENAVGLYQIRPCYVEDVNRILGKNAYKLSDRYDPDYSLYMVVTYTAYWTNVGKVEWNDENIARIHNGGPDGHLKDETLPYLEKVKTIMEIDNKLIMLSIGVQHQFNLK